MRETITLRVLSILSVLLATFHQADDVVRGFEPGGFKNVQAILTFAVWLYGPVALGGRRSGYIVMLLGGLLGCLVSMAHMMGGGLVGGRVANTDGRFFWVWTVLALGITASLSVVLSARELWSLRRAQRM